MEVVSAIGMAWWGINVQPWACGTGDALLSWQQSNHDTSPRAGRNITNKAASLEIKGHSMESKWVSTGESRILLCIFQY